MNRIQELRIEIAELSGILRGVVRQKYILSRRGFVCLTRQVRQWKIELAELEEAEMLKTKQLSDNN
jgi:hypothetical protein